MNKHNNIKSYFIKYNNKIQTDVVLENDTIFIKGVETYIPGCLDKTIKSIEYIIKTNIEFDFIFRTNLSSVVNLNKFFNHYFATRRNIHHSFRSCFKLEADPHNTRSPSDPAMRGESVRSLFAWEGSILRLFPRAVSAQIAL